MSENSAKTKIPKKKSNSNITGITIIRVAAFAFAIVSWKATADGLSEYIFGTGWQPALISFAIQSILFVFNLKLPFYFEKIGSIDHMRQRRKYHVGSKRGQEKPKYKFTKFQKVIVTFYIVVLGSSSFFSFVYICNYVVYEHQTGYVDDNAVLTSAYREIVNDTYDFIDEDTKAMQILASNLLGELQEKYPAETVSDGADKVASRQELEIAVTEAQDAYEIAEEEYNTAKEALTAIQSEMESYAESRNATTWHDRQDNWQSKYDDAKRESGEISKEVNGKKETYEAAKQALTEKKNELNNYKDSKETVISNFLLEMLKSNPSADDLEKYISELNERIVELGKEGNVVDNYSELVERTQSLSVVVKDYLILRKYSERDSDEYISNAIDDTGIPDPRTKTFEDDYVSWKEGWQIKLSNLENLIQELPKFSENEKNKLNGTIVNLDLLEEYNPNEKMNTLDQLYRDKISDINVIEKAVNLLKGKYRFSACFSLALAIFFDVSSLLSGLFIYGIRKKKSPKENLG